MKIYDVTVPISESVPIYEGDPTVKIDSVTTLAAGHPANVSQLCFGAHTGTHVDAPNHFIEGTRRLEDLDLEKLLGRCRVVRIDDSVEAIETQHVSALEGVERVLFKTRNSGFWSDTASGFRTDFTYITPDASSWWGSITCQSKSSAPKNMQLTSRCWKGRSSYLRDSTCG